MEVVLDGIDEEGESTTSGSMKSVNNDEGVGLITSLDKLLHTIHILLVVHVSCASLVFCSSPFTYAESSIDVIMATSNTISIDNISALFLCVGFLVGFVHATVPREDFDYYRYKCLIFIQTDVAISHVASVLLGTLWCIDVGNCGYYDVPMTIFEGLTSLRFMDFRQEGMHSMNMTAWPVLCLFWCGMLSPMYLSGYSLVVEKMGQSALCVLGILAVAGVVLVSVMAVIHEHTDIFYMSSRNLYYRIQEFGIGIIVSQLLLMGHIGFRKIVVSMKSMSLFIAIVFGCAWWSRVGMAAELVYPVCLRPYPLSNCLRPSDALLCRGCLLGLALLCHIFADDREPNTSTINVSGIFRMRLMVSAVSFAWPVFILIRFIAHITFGMDIVNENSSLLSAVMPICLLIFVAIYDITVKPHICRFCHQNIKTFSTHFESLATSARTKLGENGPLASGSHAGVSPHVVMT